MDWKPEKVVQAKVRDFSKKKTWLLKHGEGKTLCAGLQMATSSRLLINNGLSPQEESFATLCQVLHHQWLNLFTIISSIWKLVECLYYDINPLPILPVLSRSIESPVVNSYTVTWSYKVVHLYNRTFIRVTFIHPYINTFTYSHIHAYTTYAQHQFIHGCIGHPESCLVISLRFGPQLFQVVSPK